MLRYIYSFPEKVNGAVNNKIIKVEFSEELFKGQCDILTYRYIKKGIRLRLWETVLDFYDRTAT